MRRSTPVTAHLSEARARVTAHLAAALVHAPVLPLVELDTVGMAPEDAALARAIDQAVRRRMLTLEAIVGAHLDRPFRELEVPLRAVLLVGAAQLVLLDRVPPHAAVHEAVEWAKRRIRPGAAGLVNAVLRRTASAMAAAELIPAHATEPPGAADVPLADGRIRRLAAPLFDDAEESRLGPQTSHGEWLTRRWIEVRGLEQARAMLLHGIVLAPVVLAGLPEAHALPDVEPMGEPGFGVFRGAMADLPRLLALGPAVRVQDRTSARPVESTRGLALSVIVDLCAGRGTKTRQLAAEHPDARVIATDVDAERHGALQRAFADDRQVEVVTGRALDAWSGRADLVLTDVPCSNSGVLARRLEARYRLDAATLTSLVDTQRKILARARHLLKPGGYLLYATCSVEPEENESQVRWAETQLGLRRVSAAEHLPEGRPGEPSVRYRDGGFHALLQHR